MSNGPDIEERVYLLTLQREYGKDFFRKALHIINGGLFSPINKFTALPSNPYELPCTRTKRLQIRNKEIRERYAKLIKIGKNPSSILEQLSIDYDIKQVTIKAIISMTGSYNDK